MSPTYFTSAIATPTISERKIMSASEKLIEQRDALVLEASTALAGEPTEENNALAESRMAEA